MMIMTMEGALIPSGLFYYLSVGIWYVTVENT